MNRFRACFPRLVLPLPLALVARFALGAIAGVFLHYLLYRVSLPVEPFIYAAF
jgi:hypothetical protein